jgi:Arc/MetJ-type ribon-helix-helix transcriptional regulator
MAGKTRQPISIRLSEDEVSTMDQRVFQLGYDDRSAYIRDLILLDNVDLLKKRFELLKSVRDAIRDASLSINRFVNMESTLKKGLLKKKR